MVMRAKDVLTADAMVTRKENDQEWLLVKGLVLWKKIPNDGQKQTICDYLTAWKTEGYTTTMELPLTADTSYVQ